MPAKLQTRPWRKGNEAAGSRHQESERTPSAGPAPGATCKLGVLKDDGGAEEGGDCFTRDPMALAEGVLKS